MLQQRSVRRVVDNSGVRKLRIIHIPRDRVGVRLHGVIVTYRKGSKWSRGAKAYALRVARAKEVLRPSGISARVAESGAILINRKQEVLGTRIRGVRQLDRRRQGWSQVISIGLHRV